MKLRMKLLLPIILIAAAMSLLTAYFVADHIEQEALQRAQAMTAEHVAAKIREGLTVENFRDQDFQRQKTAFESFLRLVRTPEILKVKIFNAKFDIIYSTTAADIGTKTDSSNYRQSLLDSRVLSVIKPPQTEKANIELHGYRQLMEVYVPVVIDGKTEGVIEAYFKMDTVKDAIRATTIQVIALIIVLAAAICIAVYSILTVVVIRPLRSMTQAVEKLTAGEAGTTLPFIGTKDEISVLRDALAQMISALDPQSKKRF
ncbi:MAG: HAMP domain-containing protein [Nitrospirota bacterium]